MHACIYSFIHSGHFYSASSSPLLLRGAHDYSTDTVSGFHAEAPQATVSKGLAQGSYVAARAGVEPTTLRLRVIDLINAPPRLIMHTCIQYNYILTLLTTVSLYLLTFPMSPSLHWVLRSVARHIGQISKFLHVSAYMRDILHWLYLSQRIL